METENTEKELEEKIENLTKMLEKSSLILDEITAQISSTEKVEPEQWMKERIEIWKFIASKKGAIVPKAELHAKWKSMGKSLNGLGGFYVGEGSLVKISNHRTALTSKAYDKFFEWTHQNLPYIPL